MPAPHGPPPAPGSGWPPPGPRPWTSPPPRHDYASWWRRVAGLVVDRLPLWVAAAVLVAGYVPLYAGLLRRDLSVQPSYGLVLVGTLLYLAAFGFDVWNRWFRAGRTGQTLGRRAAGTYLVSQDTGRPIGPLAAFVRDLLHILDGWAYVGYLWPLWDEDRQTFADKILRTVVVRTRVEPLAKGEPTQLVV